MNIIWLKAVSQSDLLNKLWEAVGRGDAVEFTHVREALLQSYVPLYQDRMTAAEAEARLPEEMREELDEAWKMIFLPQDEVVSHV